MSKKLIAIILGVALVASSMQAAMGAQKIAFSWSTSLTFTYEPGGGLKAGVNPSTSSLNSWAVQVCKERYDFLYAETVGASGRALGKSDPKATKKTSKVVKLGWRMDGYGESEFFVTYVCSGSMVVPVTGPSNSYSIRPYVQDYNEYNKFKTKSGLFTPTSRSYSVEELNANGWKITLAAGQSSVGRCCSDNVWGPIPKLAKIPNINFKFVESRNFNEDDRYDFGENGKAYVFEIANYAQIELGLSEFYLGLYESGSYHGEKDDEALAEYDKEKKQLTIFEPTDITKALGTYVRMNARHTTTSFVRWHTSVDSIYVFNLKTLSITFKSSVEDIKNYPLNS